MIDASSTVLRTVLVGNTVGSFWAAYFSFEYRDIAVFTVLTLVLVFRPAGLVAAGGDRHLGRQ